MAKRPKAKPADDGWLVDEDEDNDFEDQESADGDEYEEGAESSEEEEKETSGSDASLDSDGSFEDDSEYMQDIWESDSDWEPPWMRSKKTKLKDQQQASRKRRRGGSPEDIFLLEEEKGDAFDGEEEVDAEAAGGPATYCPVDLSSFGGVSTSPSVEEPRSEVDRIAAAAAKAVAEAAEEEDRRWHGAWSDEGVSAGSKPRPGELGFNAFAVGRMRSVGVGLIKKSSKSSGGFEADAHCPHLQPHQEIVAFLLHRTSPVQRLLVDHPTGSGKTRAMIRVLDGLFFDPRPKVVIFPKQPVCRNFYLELLRWPSRYRDYYCSICPGGAALASGYSCWRWHRHEHWRLLNLTEAQVRELARSCRHVLEMPGAFFEGELRPASRAAFEARHPGEAFPGAPLRALGYASAGGANIRLDRHGRPLSAFFKVGHVGVGGNVYDHKIVLMDEVHNLVHTETQYSSQLSALRDRLYTARNNIVVGFTGTPILSEPSEGQKLLEIIKGEDGKGLCNEGYLSSLAAKPQPLFPRCFPVGVPETIAPSTIATASRKSGRGPAKDRNPDNALAKLCRRVVLRGEALHAYVRKVRGFGDGTSRLPARRARGYCNMYAWAGSYHDGANGCKHVVLSRPQGCAPKLQAVAEAVARRRLKALVLISRGSGYRAALDLMRQEAAQAQPPFGVASMDEFAEFNATENLRGERYLCLVADAFQCSEGVSFNAVRMLHIADVPPNPTTFVQQCGRASRMFGHAGLRQEEQTVAIRLWLAVLPRWVQEPLGSWALRACSGHARRQTGVQRSCDAERHALDLIARLRAAGMDTLERVKTRLDKCKSVKDVMKFKNRHGLGQDKVMGHKRGEQRSSGGKRAKPPPEDDQGADRESRQSLVLRALLDLRRAKVAEVRSAIAQESQHARDTVDETVLQDLLRGTMEFAGALSALRAQAIDKEILSAAAFTPKSSLACRFEESEEDEPLDHFEPRAKVRKKPSAAFGSMSVVSPYQAASSKALHPTTPRMRLSGKTAASGKIPGTESHASDHRHARESTTLATTTAAPKSKATTNSQSAQAKRCSSARASDNITSAPKRTLADGVASVVSRSTEVPKLENVAEMQGAQPSSGSHGASIAKRARLRGKQPPLPQPSPHTSNSIVESGPTVDAKAPQLLHTWSVKELKAEALRLKPDADMRGVVDKDDLCRLVRDLRGGESAAAVRGTASDRRVVATAPRVGAVGIAPLDAGPSQKLPTSVPAARARELEGLSAEALRDLLARVRPDLDLQGVSDRSELIRFLLPWL